MFVPEYTITNDILKYIGNIEYSRSIIENTPILNSWENQLKKDSNIKFIYYSLLQKNFTIKIDEVKKCVDGLDSKLNPAVKKLIAGIELTNTLANRADLNEEFFKQLNITLGGSGMLRTRSARTHNDINPEEVLAHLVELVDWLNSMEAKETHPVVTTGIFKKALEKIAPFEDECQPTIDLLVQTFLKISGYDFRTYFSILNWYEKTESRYEKYLYSNDQNDEDLTEWLNYFVEGFAFEVANVTEKVKLLAKDTKIAKATGRNKLSTRQERIVEHLQDYGILQNKDFVKIFPDVSEDSILRDLKALVQTGIIKKSGSTKSSRYELA